MAFAEEFDRMFQEVMEKFTAYSIDAGQQTVVSKLELGQESGPQTAAHHLQLGQDLIDAGPQTAVFKVKLGREIGPQAAIYHEQLRQESGPQTAAHHLQLGQACAGQKRQRPREEEFWEVTVRVDAIRKQGRLEEPTNDEVESDASMGTETESDASMGTDTESDPDVEMRSLGPTSSVLC